MSRQTDPLWLQALRMRRNIAQIWSQKVREQSNLQVITKLIPYKLLFSGIMNCKIGTTQSNELTSIFWCAFLSLAKFQRVEAAPN